MSAPLKRGGCRHVGETSRKWWLLGAAGTILGIILLDETVVGVALPTVQTDLGLDEVDSHWVVNVYMLVLAGFAAAAGRIGDMIGHRGLMVAGLSIFCVASLACGFASSGTWLIAARSIQGLGAAIIFPVSMSMVTTAFPEHERGFALGVYGAIGTTFLALGPMVGGLLTDIASWRWIFWLNPPITVLVAAIVLAAWREAPQAGEAERLDKTGFVLLVAGLSMVIFAVMEGPERGWTGPSILIPLLAGSASLLAFAFVERRVAFPLTDVRLFADGTFTASNLVIFTAQYNKMAIFVFGAFYLQDVLKLTPLMAGIALLPTVVVQVFLAPVAGHVADRFGTRQPVLWGLATMIGGLIVIAISITYESYPLMFPGLLAWGLSQAFLFVPPQRAVMSAVPRGKQGQAGGIAMSSQLVGAAVGMAVCSTLFSTTNDFRVVFLATALFSALVFVIGAIAIEPHRTTSISQHVDAKRSGTPSDRR
jgi:EmrB/QacA subfamily drug resistance transporter